MASLTGQLVAETYKALLKVIDNDVLTASEKQITDGFGGGSNVFIDSNGFLRANKYKVTNGLATQFLKADGSLDANTYLTSITSAQVTTALGYTPVTDQRTLTINGVTYNLTANRSWTVEGTAAVWGNITGTLSNQTDLQAALNAKYNVPAGTISQYIRGDGTLATFPTLPGGLPTGGAADQILAKIDATDYNTHWIDNYATQTKNEVKLGATLAKGAAVYVSSANGTNMIVSAASNTAESLSSKTFGLLETGGVTNDLVKCVTFGLLAGLDTSAAQAGDPVWLGVNGALLFGVANKPVAPANMVYIGVVTRVQSNNGEIFVNIQNGFEIEELHDVLIQSKANNQGLFYEASTGLWKNKSIATVLGYTPQAQLDGTGFVKASGTTITYDNSTYLTTTDAASTYQRLDNIASSLFASETNYPNNNAVIAGLALKADAANPVFTGSMNIVGLESRINFYDENNLRKYFIGYDSGTLRIFQDTGSASRFYITPTGQTFIPGTLTVGSVVKDGGTASQFLKADGSIDSNTYVQSSALADYLLISTAASTYQRLDRMSINLLASDINYPNNNAVINALALKANAANPVFTGNMTISGAEPKLFFTDTDNNPDYTVFIDSGFFYIYDQTAGATRFSINSSGNINTGVGKSITAGSFIKESGTSSQFLMADGSVTTLTNPVTGTGTSGYLPKWTSGSALGNSIIYDSGSKIGINNSNPQQIFDIRISGGVFPTLGTNPTAGNLMLSNNGLWGMYFGLDGGSGYGWIQQMRNDSAVAYPIIINPVGGNVLIGTTSDPGYKLNVNGTGQFLGKLRVNYSDTSEPFTQAHFYNTNTTTPYGGLLVSGISQGHLRLMYGSNDWDSPSAKKWQIRARNDDGYDLFKIYSFSAEKDLWAISSGGEEYLRAEDNGNANSIRYYNYANNALRFYAKNASGTTTGVQMWEYDGGTYQRLLNSSNFSSWALPLTGGTISGAINFSSYTDVITIGHTSNNSGNIVFQQDGSTYKNIDFSAYYGMIGFFDVGGGGFRWRFGVNGPDVDKLIHAGFGGVLIGSNGDYKGTWQGLNASAVSRKDANYQWIKPYYEYSDYLTNQLPSTLTSQMSGGGLRVDFAGSSYTPTGSWSHMLTWSGYNRYSMNQIATDYYTTTPRIWYRQTYNHDDSWTSWREFVLSDGRTYNLNISGNAVSANSATNVGWTGITAGIRTNYQLGFQPPANDYAGFSFTSTTGDGAGYLLIRGTSDSDIYTAEGITLVADRGWLTLAQRTTVSKGIRFMTGTSGPPIRFQIDTNGFSKFNITAGGSGSSDRVTIADTSSGTNIDLVSYVSGGAAYSLSAGLFVNGGKDMLLMVNNANMKFVTGGYTEQMRLWNNGNLALGNVSTDNGNKLQVGGSASFSNKIVIGSFSQGQQNTGEAWLGRAGDRSTGIMTVQLGGGSSGSRFEVVDWAWSVVLFKAEGNGNVTASGSMYATAFYESSDKRLKKLINKSAQIQGIEKLEAKLYEKNGKVELGYFAQDAELIMPYAVSKNADGFLNLSYREVHTAKIARLEKEVAELKEKLNVA